MSKFQIRLQINNEWGQFKKASKCANFQSVRIEFANLSVASSKSYFCITLIWQPGNNIFFSKLFPQLISWSSFTKKSHKVNMLTRIWWSKNIFVRNELLKQFSLRLISAWFHKAKKKSIKIIFCGARPRSLM